MGVSTTFVVRSFVLSFPSLQRVHVWRVELDALCSQSFGAVISLTKQNSSSKSEKSGTTVIASNVFENCPVREPFQILHPNPHISRTTFCPGAAESTNQRVAG